MGADMMRRRRGWFAVLGAVGAVPFLIISPSIFRALKAPVLNDVSTDLDDPPQYINLNIGNLPEHFKPKIRKAYPRVTPLILSAAFS